MKLPAFQFYPGDWRKDPGVQSLSYHDRGVWFEILCLMHESNERGALLLNKKAMNDEQLARLLGLDKQILTTTLSTLLDTGVATRREDGVLINRRMKRDEHIRQTRTEAGKKGGNPLLLKQKRTTQLKQKSTPSSSSSSSSSDESAIWGEAAENSGTGEEIFAGPTFDHSAVVNIYHAYPRRQGQGLAEKAIRDALVMLRARSNAPQNPAQWLLEKVKQYANSAAGKAGKFVPMPAKWFEERRFDDDPTTWKDQSQKQESRGKDGKHEWREKKIATEYD